MCVYACTYVCMSFTMCAYLKCLEFKLMKMCGYYMYVKIFFFYYGCYHILSVFCVEGPDAH